MKVIKSEENLVEFDNGLQIIGDGERDCCAVNYLDFEQFAVGTEFPTMTVGGLVDSINLKEDGFALTDSQGLPKWVQARSSQNGYYSTSTTVIVKQGKTSVTLGVLEGELCDE